MLRYVEITALGKPHQDPMVSQIYELTAWIDRIGYSEMADVRSI
jgi:hypothetical protein